MADPNDDLIDMALRDREKTRKFVTPGLARAPGLESSPAPSPVPTAPPIKKEPGYIDMIKHFFHLDQANEQSGADQAKALRGGQ